MTIVLDIAKEIVKSLKLASSKLRKKDMEMRNSLTFQLFRKQNCLDMEIRIF